MTDSYFNTNAEQGELLFKSNEKAHSQEEQILELFEQFPDKEFSPEEVWIRLGLNKTPLTSIRRAISNLSKSPKWKRIHKTGNMKAGNYGKMVHTWKLNHTL